MNWGFGKKRRTERASHLAIAFLFFEDIYLGFRRIHEFGLFPASSCLSLVQRASMPVSPVCHLSDQRVVSEIQGPQPFPPSFGFRVIFVSLFARCEDGPYGMQLSVFAEKMVPA
jgi:hypothetical protein